MPLFSKPIGIEIGPESVKVARLSKRRGAIRAIQFAEEPLPAGYRWEVGGDHQPVVDAIGAALTQAGVGGDRAVMSIPRGQVTARIAAFPPAEGEELRRVVEYDLADHIPFPVDEVVVDMQPLGPSREQPGLLDVLVVAAPRELVREYLQVAAALGLKLVALVVDALALDDLAGRLEREPLGMGVSLDVGPRATTINVTQQGRLRLTRSVAVGGRQLQRAIQEDLQVSPEEAERRKATEGLRLLNRKPEPTRVRAWFDGLMGEIRRSALSFGPAALSRLVLIGRETGLPGLAERLGAELAVEVTAPTAADLFPGADIICYPLGALDRSLTTLGPALRAIGLSKWTVSLLPGEVLQARRTWRLRALAVAAGAAAVLALGALYVATLKVTESKKAAVARDRAKVAAAAETTNRAQALLDERDQLRDQMAPLQQAQIRRYAALEILKTIAAYAPEDVVLTNFTWRPEQPLEIRGKAPNTAVVADFQSVVEASPLARRVTLSGVDRQQGRKGAGEYLTFSLEMDWWTEPDRTLAVSSVRPWGEGQ